jgi:GNAT superfamily N-acetyltransferase
MVERWQLTRNRHTRRVYEALKSVGVTATRMYEYRAEIARTDATRSPTIPEGIRLEAIPGSDLDGLSDAIDFSIPVDVDPEEWAVVVSADGRPVGRALVAGAPRPYVDVLERPVSVSGAYLRRVFVVPEWRGEGVASATLRAALALAREEFAVETATALIAADNRPSQWLFEARGFERTGVHEYARVGPLSTYRRSA